MGITNVDKAEKKRSRNAALVSLIVGASLLLAKFWAYKITHSQAVYSDAMESIVNVIAAAIAIVVVIVAAKPADKDHPYGHGKIEFFSAAFEGGLITFAAAMICYESIQAFITDRQIGELNLGLAVVLGAGLVNLVLGLFLVRHGRRVHSAALTASGQHVISDFYTSAGVTGGLLLVKFTGLVWIDSVTAFVVGILLAKTGIQVARGSMGGLLDEEDREILKTLLKVVSSVLTPGIIQIHHCRVIRSGSFHHIDAHVVIPEYWDVLKAHNETESFERKVMENYPTDGELHFHVDPCRRAYCRVCEVEQCPVRQNPFEARREWTIDEITSPIEPTQFRRPR